MVAGKRIVGGFFLVMIGFGVILDTPWDALGVLGIAAGAGLMLWGRASRG